MNDDARRRLSGYAMVSIAACGWGTWPLFLRHAPMPPSLQGAIAMGVLTLGTLPVLARDRLRVERTRFEWGLIGWLGISDAMNVLLFFAAYQRTSVAVAVLTHYLTPIFVALAAPLLLRETARARTYVAVAVAFGGLVLLLEPWRVGVGRGDVTGALLGGGSAVFYAANVLVGKRLVPAFSGSELTVFHGVITTAILVTLVSPSDVAAVSPGALGLVLLGSLGPGLTSGLLFVWGLRRIAASHASVLTLLEPFVAVLVAAAFLGERLGPVPVAGGVLILGGAALVVTGRVSSAG